MDARVKRGHDNGVSQRFAARLAQGAGRALISKPSIF
jgi:hypothetical protein